MVVIGEEYLLMNLLMDTLCLTAAMRLSSLRARPGRVLLSALAGALLSMIALSLWGLRASAYAALPIAVLMALLAFGLRRAPGGSARLLIAGLLSAGMAQYMHRLGLGGWAAALACAPGVLYAVHLLLRWQSRAGERADVRLLFERGGVSLDGLVDSGNCLRDPVTELPVVVVPYQAVRAYLPAGTVNASIKAGGQTVAQGTVRQNQFGVLVIVGPNNSNPAFVSTCKAEILRK